MKKRIFAVLLSLCMAFSLLPATALAADGVSSADALQSKLDAGGDVTLGGNVQGDFVITKNVTLNLNRYNVTNSTGHTFTVQCGATLTINGNGTVDNTTHGKAAVYNNGTVILNGGTYTRSRENGQSAEDNGGNSYYVLVNHGTMTTTDISVTQNGKYSSLFENGYQNYEKEYKDGVNSATPTLTINGGLYDGGLNTIKNDDGGSLTINAGTFKNVAQLAVMNWNEATITGGTFTSESFAVANMGNANSAYDKGVLNISGGVFIGKEGAIGKGKGADAPIVTAGVFNDNRTGAVEKNGLYVLQPAEASVELGGLKFNNVTDAVAVADATDTVKFLKDVTEDVTIEGKDITFNMNGNTLTVPTDCGVVVSGANSKLTVTGNGTVTCSGVPFMVDAGALVIENGTVNSVNDYGIYALNDGSITVNGGTLTSLNAVLTGNNTTGNMNFTVNGGTLTAKYGPAIYMPGQVSLTITGGTLNGGISLRMGQVNISGGTINAITSGIDSPKEYYAYSGNAWLPDALYVFGGTYDKGDKTYGNSLNLNITGGTFNCSNGQGSAVAIYDLGKVTQTANVNISGGKFATTTNGRNAYDVLSLTDIGVTNPETGFGDHSGDVSSAISGGFFSSDVTKYCAEGMMAVKNTDSETAGTYQYTIGTVPDNAVTAIDVSTKPGATDGSVSDNVSDKVTATAVANSVSAVDVTNVANEIAVTGTEKKTAIQQLLAAGQIKLNDNGEVVAPAGSGDVTVTIIKEPYLDVEVTALDTAAKEITLNIEPKYNLLATTDKNDANKSVVVSTGNDLKVTAEMAVKIALPDNFATAGDKLSIKHEKSTGVEYYTGAVTLENSKLYVTFTTKGFSPFTISTPAASIGETLYPALADAIAAASSGATIKLEKDCAENVTVSGKSLTIDKNNFTYDFKNVSVGANTTKKESADGNTLTVIYTRPASSSGGGTVSASYAITVDSAKNGTVSASAKSAAQGTTITVTVQPASGYVLDAVTVKDANGKTVSVTKKSDTQYAFAMPAAKVTVSAAFKAAEQPAYNGYIDVAKTAWYAGAVQYVTEKGLMNGTGENTFSPNMPMTRAMMMTILARYAGADTTGGATWYEKGMNWAVEKKISDGANPEGSITREQLITMLWRYQGSPMVEGMAIREFNDAASVSAWATDAMRWAIATGVIQGSNGNLNPAGNASRAEVATMLMRFCQL